ncbi:MAG: hypothetical protein HQL60_01850, partial [Magnetococcales bacterium]|nr:hypothetical protein [Magnetococcales bacterium]
SVGVVRVDGPGRAASLLAELAVTVGCQRFLLEQAVMGAEVTATILDRQVLPLIEIRPKQGFYDYHNKYNSGRTDYLMPPPSLSVADQAQVSQMALLAHDLVRCRGLVRVDLMVGVDLDGAALPSVLEINTIPGMTELSLAPRAAAAVGIDFDALVERILQGTRLGVVGHDSTLD